MAEPSIQTPISDGCGQSCAPGAGLDVAAAERAAAVFKALSDPVRLRLYSRIADCDGETCVCDIQDVGVSQPTVSHHLKRLTEAGLLDKVRVGRTVTHQVRPELFAELRTVLQMD